MACFYDLGELSIPLEGELVFAAEDDAQFEQTREPTVMDLPGPIDKRVVVGTGRVKTDAELIPQQQYTVRVCKDCRADWMMFQEMWWNTRFSGKSEGTGTGVFVRKHGTNVELTPEEVEQWKEERGTEPVRVLDLGAQPR
jgi:hypothetical protein